MALNPHLKLTLQVGLAAAAVASGAWLTGFALLSTVTFAGIAGGLFYSVKKEIQKKADSLRNPVYAQVIDREIVEAYHLGHGSRTWAPYLKSYLRPEGYLRPHAYQAGLDDALEARRTPHIANLLY